MDYLIVLLIGVMIGWLMNAFWLVIRNRWNNSRSLHSSYESTIKEITDKNKKAREARRKSRSVAVRAFIESALFVLVVIVLLLFILNLINIL